MIDIPSPPPNVDEPENLQRYLVSVFQKLKEEAIEEAPRDGNSYVRKDGKWVKV